MLKYLILFTVLISLIHAKKIKNFRVSPEITTGWVFCRSQALYTSEFLYEQDKELFWKFFKDLNSKKHLKQAGKSSKLDQSAIFDVLPFNRKSSAELFRLLSINLEMESLAPKFQAMAQAQVKLSDKCFDAFIEYQSGQFACSFDEIEGKDIFGIKPSIFDYKYTNTHANSPTVRIYTIAGSEKFNEFFNTLTEKGFNVVVQLLPKPSQCPFYQEEVHPVGYGLEFELKSSQYVVEEPQEEIPDEMDSAEEANILLKSFDVDAMKSFSRIKEVKSLQSRALNLFKTPKSFADILKVSTNLPLLADTLAATLKSSSSSHSGSSVGPKPSHFRINGLELKSENFDPFKLIDFINIYSKVSHEIERITKDKLALKRILNSRTVRDTKDSKSSSDTAKIRYNVQGPSVTFLNNLEKDKRYSDWLKSFDEEPSEEHQFYAKNFLSVVFPFSFGNIESIGLIESLVQLIQYDYPIRFGIIPILNDDEGNVDHWIKAFYYIRNNFGLRKLIKFLTSAIKMYSVDASEDSLSKLLKQLNIDSVDLQSDELENAKIISKKFDLNEGEVFVNGVIFPITSNFPEILMNQYSKELEIIMLDPKSYDGSDLYSKMLLGARNERFSLDSSLKYGKDHLLEFEAISSLLSIGNYLDLSSKKSSENPLLLTSWLAVEYDKKKTFSFLLHALKSLKFHSRIRIYVSNPMISMPNRIVLAASALLSESPNDFDSIVDFLDNFYENYFGGSIKNLEEIKGSNDDKISKKLLKYAADLDEPIIKEIIKENEAFYLIYSQIDYDESLLFSINGNSLLIPINSENVEKISNNLLQIAEKEIKERANRYLSITRDKTGNHVTKNILTYSMFERKFLTLIEEDLSNFVMASENSFPRQESNPIVIGDEDLSSFHVEAVFNPFNREGQKFSSIMSYLATSDSFMFSFNLYFTTNPASNDPKEARIYRFVTPETRGTPIPIVPVDDEETLMAMSIDLPSAWMTVTTYANTDLDNIRPMKVPHLQVSFSLNHLIIEGQATDDNEQVATGKLIQLYSSRTGLLESETSVMANFGYYQVKASSPGLWTLRASSSIQERQETGEDYEYPIISGGQIYLSSFGGKFNRIKMSSQGIKLTFKRPTPKQADINVFSLASGLFYERLLRIMMTSVMQKKAPEATVKFWLLETTLSAQGALALEILSKELGFEYELMSYKWPAWLNPQIKKHRTIWAYKILFLDVLFPQSLDRIIFIDADQVVRSDLMELVNLDLKGNVYAMTPFCKDKPEMAPYRFWEHNYWKNHLQGRPYHISALFVVDLLELRKRLVADIIRAQYHMLSQDPNSLANLDQDLPNNLQHHIPIYSLPQEWLWCDSWCSEATKSKAKTIDLCNNPKTFESKIDQAKRIIPEWKDYDSQIEKILEKGRKEYLKNLKNLKNMRVVDTEIIEHLEL